MFITFEGGEGSGKSTQAARLAARLRESGREVLLTREPGGTAFGEVARTLVLHHAIDAGAEPVRLDDTAELLLFGAARAQHLDELIRPALARGAIVLCDRFADSTVAYQGYGRGLPMQRVLQSVELATSGTLPDRTVLLDLPVEEGLRRRFRERPPDQIERQDTAFHARVRDGFLARAAAEPQRFIIVNATRTVPEIAAEIWTRLAALGEG